MKLKLAILGKIRVYYRYGVVLIGNFIDLCPCLEFVLRYVSYFCFRNASVCAAKAFLHSEDVLMPASLCEVLFSSSFLPFA